MTALDIAKYILTKCSKEESPISNLQLQKMLYYIQYEFLTKKNKPLFDDDFEAWKFGPVVPKVYYTYSYMGAFKIIANYDNYDSLCKEITSDDKKLLDNVIENKRQKDVWFLVDDTHKKGGAWDKIFNNGIGLGNIISKKEIKENAFGN